MLNGWINGISIRIANQIQTGGELNDLCKRGHIERNEEGFINGVMNKGGRTIIKAICKRIVLIESKL